MSMAECGKAKKDNAKSQKEEEKLLDYGQYELIEKLNTLGGDTREERTCLNEYFKNQAQILYSDLCKRTYKVPDVHFNKGKTVEETQIKQSKKLDYHCQLLMNDADARGDRAHAKVVNTLTEMSEYLKEKGLCPLFIINSYHNDSYLARLRPNLHGNLDFWKNRGEMDMLILTPDMAVFIETKSTGDNLDTWSDGKDQQSEAIGKRIKQVFKQLNRSENAFKMCMEESLLEHIKSVHRIAAFPNLTHNSIQDAISKRPDILSQSDIEHSQNKLLCSDYLKSAEALTDWWLKNIEGRDKTMDGVMDPMSFDECECDQQCSPGIENMKIIIGRYLGGMSVVDIYRGSKVPSPRREVRRKAEAVSATGSEFSKIILTQEQVNYVNNDVRLGYLNGPPGSGKTVVLAIRGRRWIIQEKGVTVILNMYRGSKGRSIGEKTRKIIYKHQNHRIKEELKKNCVQIRIDVATFFEEEKKKFNDTVTQLCPDKQRILFLVDETYVQFYWKSVFDMLIEDYNQSQIWLAGLYGGKPEHFENMPLTEVMRCPPNVQNILYHVDWLEWRRKQYKCDSTKANMSTDGADVMVIMHKNHLNPNLHPAQCRECGEYLVDFLENTLQVRKSDQAPNEQLCPISDNGLMCSDIVILVNLPRNLYIENDHHHLDTNEYCYTEYMKLIQSSVLVKTLDCEGYKTKVHTTLPCSELAGGKNEIIHVSWVFSYQGLENKVVIYLPAGPAMSKETVLKNLPEEGRAILEDPGKNIPSPGLIGVGSNSNYKTQIVSFCNTNTADAVDSDSKTDSDVDSLSGSTGSYRERASSGLSSSTEGVRKFKEMDLIRYSRWDKSTLFISASRCTAQLILITP